MADDIEEEAKARQGAAFRDGERDAWGRTVSGSLEPNTEANGHRAREVAGALVGVAGSSIARAKRVQRKDPEMFEQVKAGTVTEVCERCQRPAPPWESAAYSEWEALELDDGSTGVVCPGCLTLEEEHAIADDMEDLARESQRWREEGRS